jgi:hypothetical protein
MNEININEFLLIEIIVFLRSISLHEDKRQTASVPTTSRAFSFLFFI